MIEMERDLEDWINQSMLKYREWIENKTEEILDNCLACGACIETCRGFNSLPQNVTSISPNEINEAFLEILKTGQVQPSPQVNGALDFVNACGQCEECKLACPAELNPPETIRLIKYIAFESGITPPDYVLQAHRYISQPYCSGQICFPSAMENIQWTPDERKKLGLINIDCIPENPEQKDVVVMGSCMAAVVPDCLIANVDVLNAIGISYATLAPIDYCCGYPESNEGSMRGLFERNLRLAYDAAKFNPKQLIIGCPTCYETFYTWLHKTSIVQYPFEIKETVQLYANHIDELKPKLKRGIDRVVALQDSCHIGRCSGEYDAQRKVVEAIPGIKLVEMKHSRENAICCGWMDFIHDDRGWGQREAIFEEAKEVKAEAIVTVCHMCNKALSPLEDEFGIEVINYNTLLGQALGYNYDKKLHKYIKMDPDDVMEAAQSKIEKSPFGKEATEAMAKEYISRWGLGRYRRWRQGK